MHKLHNSILRGAACGEHRKAIFYTENLQKIKFEENSQLKKIGNNAFENCDNLSKIVLPENVESVGEKAFYHCDLLEDVRLNNKLNSLSSNVFCSCKNLKQIEFLEGLTFICDGAFGNCYELQEIILPKTCLLYTSDAADE